MNFHDISLHLTCSLVDPNWEKKNMLDSLDVPVPPVVSPCPSSSAPRRRLAPTPAAAAVGAAAGGAAAGPRWRRRKPLGAPGELGRLPPWPGLPINLNYYRS